jgi:hypothetical protein
MEEPKLNERLVEWLVSHSLWELCKVVVTVGFVWLIGVGGANLWHATMGTAFNISLVLIGILGIAWMVGILPIRRNNTSSASRDGLIQRCDDVILRWKKLAEDYLDSPKQDGQPVTLPNPMDPSWRGYGHKDWLYPVGVSQAYTHVLRQELEKANIQVEEWNYRMSMAELLEALEKYRRQISSLSN